METSNLDLKKINQLFHETNIEKAAKNEPGILPDGVVLQAPGYSPATYPRQKRRTKFSKLQLMECIKLSRSIGTESACKQMCVTPASLYAFARSEKLRIGNQSKKRKARISIYTNDQLDRVVHRAMEWHRNAPAASSMRKCCIRAGESLRINGHTAYGHYNLHREAFQAGTK